MKDIKIKPVLNGWKVQVGCSEVVFTSLDKMTDEINRYITNPKDVEKEYSENAVNKMPLSVDYINGTLTMGPDGTVTRVSDPNT